MKLRALIRVAPLALLVIGISAAQAQDTLYWDLNGALSGGSDNGISDGTWDSVTSHWNPVDSGDGPTQAWVPGSTAVFSAGIDAAGAYTVTINGTQSAAGVTFRNGFEVTLTGGQLDLSGTATVSVPSASVIARINSVIGGSAGLISAGDGILELGGANTYTGATNVSAGSVLKLVAAEVIPDGSVVTLENGNVNTAFNLNGFDDTVKSIATSGTGSAPKIRVGSNTLTLTDPDGENYGGLFSSTSGGRVIKNGSGNLILTGFSTDFNNGEFILNSGNVAIGTVNIFGTNANDSKLTINGGSLSNNSPGSSRSMSVRNIDIGGSFDFNFTGNGNVEFVGGSGAVLGNPIITLKAANPTITVNNSAGSTGILIFRGAIGDEGAARGFTKAGNGILSLQHNGSTFSGDVTIAEGTLRVVHQTSGSASVPPSILAPTTSAIGNGAGSVFLAGGTLTYNGARQDTNPRSMPVLNPIVVTQDSAITYETTGNQGTDDVTFEFTNDSISGTGGTLTISRTTPNVNTLNTYRPTFSGSGFNFSRPVVISEESAAKRTVLTSSNTSGTQTWSGAISGNAGYRRTGDGVTVFSGANTYSGGTTVDGGTLQASGADATFGSGDLFVNAGVLEILGGVSNAIADTATLNVSGSGIVSLGAGINEVLAALVLGGEAKGPGTYGSSSSSATFHFDQYFTGTGILTVPSAGVAGDYNGDGLVNAADYVLWRKNPGAHGGNPDGYNTWKANFGNASPAAASGAAAASAAVPEPASMGLLLIGIACAAARRRQRMSR